MINVSNTYKNEIYNDNTKTICSVVYGAYDVTAKNMASVTSNSEQSFAPPTQTLDAIDNWDKYTDLELNNWVLDGSVKLFPNSPTGKPWGWWSLELSNSSGEFTTNPTLTYTWNENHSSIGVTIRANNPLKEIKLYWYNSGNTLIDSYTYTNSDLTLDTFSIEHGVTNYQKLVIEFVRTIPYHYIKVQDILFGNEYIWDDEIIDLSVEESLDEKMQRLVSKQTTIKLGNIDNTYNKYNPNNKLQYFQEGQVIQVFNTAELSTGLEQVPLGQFYLTSWGSPTEYTVEFKGNDLLYKLNDLYYYSKMYTNATVKTIVDDLLSSYASSIQYNVANNIKNVQLTGFIPIISYREALQHIAFSAGGVCYVDRNGVLQIKRIDTTVGTVDTIDFTKKAQSLDQQAEKYNSVTVTCYSYNVGETTELFKGAVTGDQILTFSNPASNISVSGTYTSYTAYANCIKIVGASGTITITGKPYTISEQPITAYVSQDTSVGITKKNMPVDSVYLIGNQTTATYVATWLLNWLQNDITNEFKWLGNPAIEIGDYVTLEVAENLTKKTLIHKNKFKYNGALTEESEVVL